MGGKGPALKFSWEAYLAQLTLDDKREITRRLGYRLEVPDGEARGSLIDPDGRHKGLFIPCKATDIWAWNEAVFRYKLSRHKDGGVFKRLETSAGEGRTASYEHVWPGEKAVAVLPKEELEDLGGMSRTA